ALLAVANQGRALNGLGSLDGGQATLYQLPSSDFHDVVSGSNGYRASTGYDLATGLGSPRANLVIADLAKLGATAQTATVTAVVVAGSTTTKSGSSTSTNAPQTTSKAPAST